MLTTIDAGATRIAQAGSGVLSTANQISSSFAGQPTSQSSQVVPSATTTPPAGGFVLPPGVFDQTIR
jgi:hypothetical protein